MVNKYSYLISLMTWSFSRLRAYEDCGYSFFLKYIYEEKEATHFYAGYGSLMHHILEQYYSGNITKEQALDIFIQRFLLDIPTDVRPGILSKYYSQGKEYLATLRMPGEKVIGTEQNINFEIGGYLFTGYIDLLLEDNGELIIEDHKSRILKQKSFVELNKSEQKANNEFDNYAKQLYIYSQGIEQIYGKFPKEIRFNCFRSGEVISEKFNKKKCDEAKQWAEETIHRIEQETQWDPSPEWFKCNNICGYTDICEYAKMI